MTSHASKTFFQPFPCSLTFYLLIICLSLAHLSLKYRPFIFSHFKFSCIRYICYCDREMIWRVIFCWCFVNTGCTKWKSDSSFSQHLREHWEVVQTWWRCRYFHPFIPDNDISVFELHISSKAVLGVDQIEQIGYVYLLHITMFWWMSRKITSIPLSNGLLSGSVVIGLLARLHR